MANSSIEWTEMTWNPTTGCTKISSGCKNCYAEVMTRRLKAMGQDKYKHGFNRVAIHPNTLSIPYTWKSSKMIFVNSMSDLFHQEIPLQYIKEVFQVMNENPQHVFQILTKRADRLFELSTELHWTHNIWMGVSVENKDVMQRIDLLRQTSAKVKFISFEPLLGPLPNLNLKKIDWVIVGGESGPKARNMKQEWVSDLQHQCKKTEVAFFFKQWGGQNKKANGRLLNGKIYSEMPQIKEIENE
jgi:protein gp37